MEALITQSWGGPISTRKDNYNQRYETFKIEMPYLPKAFLRS